jgi:excisionase family DNA binding protein
MRLRDANFAAEILSVTRQRIYELVRENFFPAGVVVRLGTRQLRFHEEALLEWINRGGCVQAEQDKTEHNKAVAGK